MPAWSAASDQGATIITAIHSEHYLLYPHTCIQRVIAGARTVLRYAIAAALGLIRRRSKQAAAAAAAVAAAAAPRSARTWVEPRTTATLCEP